MPVNKRIPVAKGEDKNVSEARDIFINSAERLENSSIKNLQRQLEVATLEELARKFTIIDNQATLIKGLILLEAESRFNGSKTKFGQWIKEHELLRNYSQQHLYQVKCFASFFKDRDMRGISMTAGYMLSAPSNEAVASKVYAKIKNKGYTVRQVRSLLEKEKMLHAGVDPKIAEKAAQVYLEECIEIQEGAFTEVASQGTLATVMPPEVKELADPNRGLERVIQVVLEELSLKPGEAIGLLEHAVAAIRERTISKAMG